MLETEETVKDGIDIKVEVTVITTPEPAEIQ